VAHLTVKYVTFGIRQPE